ncbi:hypothetical protein CH278_23705 [Rhodococcus sp. 05-2254-5]|nr:hypothetical protein A2J02_22325 [Rhodococcus sp. EPR-147]KZF09089.1 hypothetical protein A2J04_22855 [Rhodococcus sp. EPR-279]OZC42587.1 hypothetical protein CH286_25995 [Rhodococcus sp. WWJCD1]OZC56432.1 hypothetical protein CH267_10750 [Rhodococcus sp. 06-621-2]OZD55850.1 hypothetical protein CH266_00560 [Rhodococcus sp. 06-1474-1B]OZE28429.1 hypothetical protein CH278_23705 [Rhodococcus sp. 05-2254-5]OZE38215.1 hypothetical protein CH256_07940 [Rhodococcus sp. 05-2254-6]OZE57076.1 hyp
MQRGSVPNDSAAVRDSSRCKQARRRVVGIGLLPQFTGALHSLQTVGEVALPRVEAVGQILPGRLRRDRRLVGH